LARKVHNYERGDLIMSGGKGGSTTSAQQIPEWIEGPAKANLEKARLAGEIGYMPYYGPDVAALSPMQKSAMQNTTGAMSAFGMAPAEAPAEAQYPIQPMMGQQTQVIQPPTNQSLVRDMYARADRTGNQVGQGEIDYWTGQLDSGALSPAGFEKAFTTARNEQYKAQNLGTPRELISSRAFAQMQPEGYLPRETTMGGVTGYSSGNLYDQAVAELARRNPAQADRYMRAMASSTSDATSDANQGSTQTDPRLNPASPMYDPAYYNRVMASGGGGGGGGGPQVSNNYWAQREAEVGKAQAFAEQSAQNQKISDGLTSFGKMGFGGILGAITGGTRNNDGATGVGVGGGPVGAGGGNASRGFSYGGW
jgi:hypothetical protein